MTVRSMIQSKKKNPSQFKNSLGTGWGEGRDFREGILECSLHLSNLHCGREGILRDGALQGKKESLTEWWSSCEKKKRKLHSGIKI